MAIYWYGYNDDKDHGDIWTEADAIEHTKESVREIDQNDWVGDPSITRPAFEDESDPSVTWGFRVKLETAT